VPPAKSPSCFAAPIYGATEKQGPAAPDRVAIMAGYCRRSVFRSLLRKRRLRPDGSSADLPTCRCQPRSCPCRVHGRNRFPVIRKKHAPTFDGLGVSRCPLHPAGDDSLGDIKAQHEKLAVNARRAPGWVFRHHTEDQLPNLRGKFFPAELFPHSRDQAPVQSKSGAMPATDRLRIDEHERLLPSTQETTGEYPEDFVNRSHLGSGMLALQHRQLLSESEILQEQASMRTKAAAEQAQP